MFAGEAINYSTTLELDKGSAYIFVFDKVQWQRMKGIGIKNVFFMPLAIHGEKIKMELRMSPKKYMCDVAFVGQLYRVNNTEAVVAAAPEQIKEEINVDMKIIHT